MSGKKFRELSLVIFGYNEGGTLRDTAEKSLRVLREIADFGELIIVDDGSTDNSASVCQTLQKQHRGIIMHRFEMNSGIGRALLKGYELASCEFVCAIPADGQFDVNELLNAPAPLFNEVISFSREINKVYRRGRKLLTLLNALFNYHLLDLSLRDVNWIKIYPARALSQLKIECSTSIVESEICAKLNLLGLKFIEIPSHYHPRRAGESKSVNPVAVFKVMMELGKLFSTVRQFKKQRPSLYSESPSKPRLMRQSAGDSKLQIH